MDVDAALQSQIRNIETTYGKSLGHWFAAIDASGLTKHNQVVAMLKAGDFGPLAQIFVKLDELYRAERKPARVELEKWSRDR